MGAAPGEKMCVSPRRARYYIYPLNLTSKNLTKRLSAKGVFIFFGCHCARYIQVVCRAPNMYVAVLYVVFRCMGVKQPHEVLHTVCVPCVNTA